MPSERGAVWGKVELVRRAISQQGMPAEARNQFGRAGDVTLLEAKSRDEFEQHCAAASQTTLNAPVAEIIREAQEKGIRVVFIVMLLTPRRVRLSYGATAWASYQQHIRQLLDLHLSQGPEEFSRRLAAALCSGALNSCSRP